MKIKTTIIISTAILMVACSGAHNVSQWSDQEIDAWFAASEWQTSLPYQPAPETDKRQFAEQVLGNPGAWQATLAFLQANDPRTLADSTYAITADGSVSASISRYMTKDSANFEAHRKYIDLQYVIEGQEYIQITSIDSVNNCIQPYNAVKDIEFHSSATSLTECLADPSQLVILFPNQAHKPCMKVCKNTPVRKIVVKIPYIEKQ